MGYERYSRDSHLGDYYNPGDPQDTGRDYGSGRNFGNSSAREYRSAGMTDRDSDGARGDGWRGDSRYYQRDERLVSGGYGAGYGAGGSYRGSYSDGRHFAEANRGDYRRGSPDPRDRGFFDRAGDEIRSWFGDEDAERRRDRDTRYDQQRAAYGDDHYHGWRRDQIAALDSDYSEYRRENRDKFEREFSIWRTERQGQRSSLSNVSEHMDVVGSDGAHVGTVDKVRGDRILLTKGDKDADGRHHSIPSRWIQSVDDKVTLRKTADEAHAHWREEERDQALFNEHREGTRGDGDDDRGNSASGRMLNRSFSGTY
ncbi:MAG: DUF2171 domain-containing protein [Pseudomonadota bacterium]|nr:DUF2171 domain-containing protein [Pseudomonadota bacterium]